MKLRWLGDGVSLIFDIVSALFLYGIVLAVCLFFALLSWTDLSMETVVRTIGIVTVATLVIGTVWGPMRRFAGSVAAFVLSGFSS